MTKRPVDPIAELKPTPPVEDADVVDQPGPPSYEEEIEPSGAARPLTRSTKRMRSTTASRMPPIGLGLGS